MQLLIYLLEIQARNKMEKKHKTTLSEQSQNRISKSLKEVKSIPLTQIHDGAAHFPSLVQAQLKVARLS